MAFNAKTYTGDLTTALLKRLLSAYFKEDAVNYISQDIEGDEPTMVGGQQIQ